LKNIPKEETQDLCLQYRGEEGRGGINRFLSLKEGKGWKVQGRPRDGTGKNGGRASGGGSCSKVLGDRG